MVTATMSTKGQVVVPVEVRRKLATQHAAAQLVPMRAG